MLVSLTPTDIETFPPLITFGIHVVFEGSGAQLSGHYVKQVAFMI